MITVEQRAVGRDNNFNLVRMIAASAVLVSHAWPIALGAGTIEPLAASTGYKLGTTAVTIFFAISGFFITKSFDQRKSITDFIVARVARIYPGLLAVLLLSVLVLGPLFTELPTGTYLRTSHTWTYLPYNLALRFPQYGLPGVFGGNPAPQVINGSLWTLHLEVSCYVLVVLAGLTRLSRPFAFPVILIAAIVPIFVVHQSGSTLLRGASTLSLPFALGAAAYVYRRYVPLSGLITLGLLAIAVVTRDTMAYPLLHAVVLSYAALWIGFAPTPMLHRYNLFGDYSYGMYIYAFPIEQAVAASVHSLSPLGLIAISFPITLAFAVASWKLIEAPALAHRHFLAARLRLRRIRADEAAPTDGNSVAGPA